jgi:hypothetical protein
VCEKDASKSGPSFPRRRASVGVGLPSSSRRTTTARSAGRKSKRRSTTFERICPTSRASMSVRATMTIASKTFSRVAGRRPAIVPPRSSLTFACARASNPKSRLKSAIDLTKVALESLIDADGRPVNVGCSFTVRVNVPTVRTSPGWISAFGANSPLIFRPFVDFRSSTVHTPPRSDRSACLRETEKSLRTIPFSLERPIDTSFPESRYLRVCPSTS